MDLALVDVLMSKMSGLELVKMIRGESKLKDLKIAFLTVLTFSDAQKKEIEKLKISDHIQKPFDNEDLLRRVNKMIGK